VIVTALVLQIIRKDTIAARVETIKANISSPRLLRSEQIFARSIDTRLAAGAIKAPTTNKSHGYDYINQIRLNWARVAAGFSGSLWGNGRGYSVSAGLFGRHLDRGVLV